MSNAQNSWFRVQAVEVEGESQGEIDIYNEIGSFGVSARAFARQLKDLGDVSVIRLRLNSPGGDILAGNTIFNLLTQHPARVEVEIDWAASMAGVIAMAGDHVVIAENGWFMIHNPWTISFGGAEQLRKDADLLDQMRDHIIQAYQRHTDLDADELQALMDAETWMDGAEAVARGFADEMSPAIQAAASVVSGPLDLDAVPEGARKWLAEQQPKDENNVPADDDAESETETTQGSASPAPAGCANCDVAYDEGYEAGKSAALAAEVQAIEADYQECEQAARAAWDEERQEHCAKIEALEGKCAGLEKALAKAREDNEAAAARIAALSAKLGTLVAGFKRPPEDETPADFMAGVDAIRASAPAITYEEAHRQARQRWPGLYAGFLAAQEAASQR